MSVSSTNLSGNNVTAFNRYRRLAAEKARAEKTRAEAEAQKAKQRTRKRETKPVELEAQAPKPEPVSQEPFSDVETEPKDGE